MRRRPLCPEANNNDNNDPNNLPQNEDDQDIDAAAIQNTILDEMWDESYTRDIAVLETLLMQDEEDAKSGQGQAIL